MGDLEQMDVFAAYFSEKLIFIQPVLSYRILFILDVVYIVSLGVRGTENMGADICEIKRYTRRKIKGKDSVA